MSSTYNKKRRASYPTQGDRFGKREARMSSHCNSMVDIDADYSLSSSDGIDYVRNNTASPWTVTLPEAARSKGRVICFTQSSTGTITVAQNADGAAISGTADTAATGDWSEVFCTGTEWIVTKTPLT